MYSCIQIMIWVWCPYKCTDIPEWQRGPISPPHLLVAPASPCPYLDNPPWPHEQAMDGQSRLWTVTGTGFDEERNPTLLGTDAQEPSPLHQLLRVTPTGHTWTPLNEQEEKRGPKPLTTDPTLLPTYSSYCLSLLIPYQQIQGFYRVSFYPHAIRMLNCPWNIFLHYNFFLFFLPFSPFSSIYLFIYAGYSILHLFIL